MRFSSIRYLLKEGIKNIWVNRMMSLASIGVLVSCLILTGVALVFSLNINNLMSTLDSNNLIKVILKQEVEDAQAALIGNQLKEISNIDECVFITKEDAFEELNQTLTEDTRDLFDGMEPDFLPYAYRVTFKDMSRYSQTVSQINDIEGVEQITDRSKLADSLTGIRRFITSAGFWIILLLLIVSMFIISNTIRVTMYAHRLEVSIMKSVGATDSFIRLPFIVEGIFIGLISGVLTTGILYFIYNGVVSAIKKSLDLRLVPYQEMLPLLTVLFISIGVIFGILGGALSISRYLKGEGGDIIDW